MALRFWHQWLRNLPAPKQTISRPAARQRPRLRPCLEALEDRTLLSLDFNSALNLDTYAWVKLHTGDPLLPLDPIPKTIGDLQDTIKYNWNQGRSPDAVAIGDFNGDGNPDIAVADFNAGNQGKISILLGSGDGSFAHTQPVVDLTTNPQRIGLLDSGGIAPVALVAARLRGPNAPLDLIVANRGIDGLFANVSVLLGNGDGNFQAPKPFEAGLAPTALAVGDFNGDGNLDVVVADRTFLPGTATVLFGDGNGGFSSSVSLGLDTASSFSFYPESVAVGDFYGDGHLDFVTANSGSNNVTVVRGNGDGTFRSAVSYGTDTAPVSVAVADMNGDGRLDIITANNGGDDVSILFQNPDGSYPINSPLIFPAGLTPTAVVVGNFDGAGPGLAVTNGQDSAASGNAVAILRFNPSHNPDNSDLLLPPTFYRTGQHPVSVAAAHLRPGMPGVVDLVVANFGSTLDRGSVSVLLGRAIAQHGLFFSSPGSFPTDLQPGSVAVGDFNGDGFPDFVAANSVTNDLTVWLNDPQSPGSNFLPLTDANGNLISLNPLGVNPKKVVVGDFNGDGLPDIAVADFGDFGVAQAGTVTVFLNNGNRSQPFSNDRQFATVTVARPDVYLLDMVAGDFNGDGNLDVAVLFLNALTGRFGIAVLLGDGKGNLTPGPDTLLPIEVINPTSITVGDFNGDGKPDIAVSNFLNVDNPRDNRFFTLYVLNGNGNGTFQDPVGYHAGTHVSSVAAGRLRGKDQPVDIVVTNENFPGGVTVFLNNGDGTFPEKGASYFAGTNPVSLVIADLNGDGIPDIAVTNINGDSVSVLFGHPNPADPKHGDGTFVDTVAYVTGGFPTSIAAADFFNHADGRLDLITSDSASNDVSVIENIEPSPAPPAPPGPGGAAPFVRQEPAPSSLAPSDLDALLLALGGADRKPTTLVGPSDVRTNLDKWQALVRRHRVDDNEMFSALLWEEDYMIVRDSEAH